MSTSFHFERSLFNCAFNLPVKYIRRSQLALREYWSSMLFYDLALCSLVFAPCETKDAQVAMGVLNSWCQRWHIYQAQGSCFFSFAFIVLGEPFAKGNTTLQAAKFANLLQAAVNSEL